ncbi:MAG: DUF2059 domain-containing protein [Caulobacterales bacterium]|nr:DUF2059 domain-containing protein [Caulobacterales bacterium]
MNLARTLGTAAAFVVMVGGALAQPAPPNPARLALARDVAALRCAATVAAPAADNDESLRGSEALMGLVYAFSRTDFEIDLEQFDRSWAAGGERAAAMTQAAIAETFAQSLSSADLRAVLDFYRSPAGQSALCAEQADADLRVAESLKDEPATIPPYVEPEEERRFLETPAGQAFRAAWDPLRDTKSPPLSDFTSIMVDQTQADYCQRRTCGELQNEFFLRLRMYLAPDRANGETAQFGKSVGDLFPDARVAALARAACAGDAQAVAAAIRDGVDPNANGIEWMDRTGSGRVLTPLIWAIDCGSPEGVEALLVGGADPNRAGKFGVTATTIAAAAVDPRILPVLLRHGGDPHAHDDSDTALAIALETGFGLEFDGAEPAVAWSNWNILLAAGADPNRGVGESMNPVQMAALRGRFDKVYEILLRGYQGDLRDLGRWVTYSKEQDAEAGTPREDPWRDKVEALLTERGVIFPVLPDPIPDDLDEDP